MKTFIFALSLIFLSISVAISGVFYNFGDASVDIDKTTLCNANVIYFHRITVDITCVLKSVAVYSDTDCNIKIGLYKNNQGVPDGLVSQVETEIVAGGFNSFAVQNIKLSPGYYWLAILSDKNYNRALADSKNEETFISMLQNYQDNLPETIPEGGVYQTGGYTNFDAYIIVEK